MDSDTIREAFLGFFEGHDHRRISGGTLVPKNDPTLLFVNSGMAPLKKYFTGEEKPPHPDLCNVQGCLRTRDIDDVGDRHHLTFFEMMGSWSIGHYFKDRAIELAFDLLTNGFKLKAEDLYVSVFAGDAGMGIPADEESAVAWERVGIARDHIVALPAEDNFWGPAGESGPCGPCTEVFLDTGDAFGPQYRPGGEFDTQGRYIEIWNAGVFMQFDKGLDGAFRPLPFASVDTGSGLERVSMALGGHDTVYETDLLAPILRVVQETFGEVGEVQPHHRVITDHMRASVAILSEGVTPSNEGRGYIPRRLVRKCVTEALRRGQRSFVFEPIVDSVVDRLGRYYPHFVSNKDAVLGAMQAEWEDFGTAVNRGLERLDTMIGQGGGLSGADAFHLFSTYGLPVEITRDLAAERGVEVSLEEFGQEFKRHQAVSRGGGGDEARRLRVDDTLPASISDLPKTEFLGYEELEAEGRVLALFVNGGLVEEASIGQEVDVIVDRTPFYPEGGGQVGDRGWMDFGGRADVHDTVSHATGRSLHRVTVTDGTLKTGEQAKLRVDPEARASTASNHTATHLLNAALRKILGEHVTQAGSLVEPERLRFDFTHPKGLTDDELAEVERLVNERILRDDRRRVDVMSPEEAVAQGAVSLEGETYADDARVVTFGEFSKELCGGTHVDHTALIGSFRITSEQGIAAGIRRINALTQRIAVDYTLEQARTLSAVTSLLRTNPRDAVDAVERLLKNAYRKERQGPASVNALSETTAGDFAVVTGEVDADGGAMRTEAQRLRNERNAVVMLWGQQDGKASVVVAVPQRYADRLSASDLVRALMGRIGGSGGGSGEIAQGGVKPAPEGVSLAEEFLAVLAG